MTYNTQELRKLDSFRAINSLMLDAKIKVGYREQHIDYIVQEVLNWHNKQVEEVLERLGVQIDYNKHDFGDMGKFIRIKYVDNLIEAERNKLKESKDE